MNNYEIKYFLKDGKINTSKIVCPKESFKSDSFCKHIRENFNPDKISRLMVYENGRLIEGCLPPVWVNHKGYVFSSRGLEKIENFDPSKHDAITANYHVNEDCGKFDQMSAGIDMEAIHEKGIRKFTIGSNGEIEVLEYDDSRALPAKELSGRYTNLGVLASLAVESGNKVMDKKEILEKVKEKGVYDSMKGPFKELRVWNKLKRGVFIRSIDPTALLCEYRSISKSKKFKGKFSFGIWLNSPEGRVAAVKPSLESYLWSEGYVITPKGIESLV